MFITSVGQSGRELANGVFSFLDKHGVHKNNIIMLQHGKSLLFGLQARMKEAHPLAFYIPCSAQTHNLIGSSAATCCKFQLHTLSIYKIFIIFFLHLPITGIFLTYIFIQTLWSS